jgi:ABC-type sugar transport system substrate-binding protein
MKRFLIAIVLAVLVLPTVGCRKKEGAEGKAKLVVIKVVPGSASTTARENGFMNTVKNKYSTRMVVVDSRYGMSDRAKSLAVSEDLLTANPDLNGIFASNESSTVGALEAVRARGLAGKVKLIGFDSSPSLEAGVKDGTIDSLVVQDPFNIGYQGVKTVVDKLSGKAPPKTIATKATLITRDNITTPEIQALLNPDIKKYLQREGEVTSGEGKKVIAVIPKSQVHIFWQTVHAGAIAAGLDLGARVLWKAPTTETDYAEQVRIVEDFITQKVDGIVLAPTDRKALVPYIERAAKEGIPLTIFDSGADTEQYVSFVATDNYQGGVMAAERMAEILERR